MSNPVPRERTMKKEVTHISIYFTSIPWVSIGRGKKYRKYYLSPKRACLLFEAILNGSRKVRGYYGHINGPDFYFEPTKHKGD